MSATKNLRETAILYIRVSTDEQKERGYSLADQEESLLKYCERNNIEVLEIFREDYSAKTVDRPSLKKLIDYAKSNKAKIDHLLFVRWDRFARNTKDSYILIDLFRLSLSIETTAIEQPLDFEVPEAKIMLAVYVSTPQVENERRSLNVRRGMRMALKTGRYLGRAPFGYSNCQDKDEKPILVIDKSAGFVRKAFEDIALHQIAIEDVRRRLNKSGVQISRAQFNRMMHNPLYMGKVRVPASKGFPEEIVDGIHEPIVSPQLFYQVQDIIRGRKPKNTQKFKINVEFPLRGFLKCARCGNTLTASQSRGRRGGRYAYYHCSGGCKERLSANQVNGDFIDLFSSIARNIEKSVSEMFNYILDDVFKDEKFDVKRAKQEIEMKIQVNRERIDEAMKLMVDKKIGAPDYIKAKEMFEKENGILAEDIEKLKVGRVNAKSFEMCSRYFDNLDSLYVRVPTKSKRIMVGSIFAEKLVYEKNGFRTPVVREIVQHIKVRTRDLQKEKTRSSNRKLSASRFVVRTGIEPVLPE